MSRLHGLLTDPPQPPQPGPDGIARAPSGEGPGRFEGWSSAFHHPGR